MRKIIHEVKVSINLSYDFEIRVACWYDLYDFKLYILTVNILKLAFQFRNIIIVVYCLHEITYNTEDNKRIKI